MAQFIGGEPTLHPQFADLLSCAVEAGLAVEVYTNLTHVRASWWDLFACPQVSLATSYYSDDPGQHDAVTGRRGSHARTRANIAEAVRRGIRLRAGIITVREGQRAAQARAELEALGVTRIGSDRLRHLGRAAGAGQPDVSELCGKCGHGIAAILPSGDVTPCVMARWLTAGNVRDTPLADILSGPAMAAAIAVRARLVNGASILDVGTGSGYGAALLALRFGAGRVTSIDVDPYLTATAAERLDSFGARPRILTADAAGELPGSYDRIVPMVSLPGIPASWLAALRPAGWLVFSLTGGSVLITARKTADGGAVGRVEFERASFMAARHGPDSPPRRSIPEQALDGDGEQVTTSPYPVIDPAWGWELNAMLSVTAPGLTIRSHTDDQAGVTTTWIAHGDGSWARATGTRDEPAVVHQAGPRRLWDILDNHRRYWLTHGYLPLRGARAQIEPDGTCHLNQDQWHATIPPAALAPGRTMSA